VQLGLQRIKSMFKGKEERCSSKRKKNPEHCEDSSECANQRGTPLKETDQGDVNLLKGKKEKDTNTGKKNPAMGKNQKREADLRLPWLRI